MTAEDYEFDLNEFAEATPARIAHWLTVRYACTIIAEANGVPFEEVWQRARGLHDYYGLHWHFPAGWPFVGTKLGYAVTAPTVH